MTPGNPREPARESTRADEALRPFLAAFAADRAARRIRPLAFYIALCPGHEADVAEQFATLLAAQAPAHDLPASIGPYRVEREVGRGGQGAVYLAADPRLGRPVAIKVLTGRGFADPVARARFLREARVAGRLEHPNLCPVYDIGVHDGDQYLVMRYLDGESLAHADAPRGTTRAGVAATLQIFETIARAVHAAHEAGVVHRDLKPGNVMLDRAGEPVILDFGLAHDETDDAASLTHITDRIGTPAYMAPEQIEPSLAPVNRSTDVWALGVMLWERLLGQRPFTAPTPTALGHAVVHAPLPDPRRRHPLVSRDLAVVLTTALQRAPADRYRTALDLAEDLRRVRAGLPILARPPGPFLRTARWVARNRLVTGLGSALLLSLLVGLWFSVRANRELAAALGATQWRADAHSLDVLLGNNRQVWRRDENDLWMIELAMRRFEELLARRDSHTPQFAAIPSEDGLSRRQLEDLLRGLDRLRDDPSGALAWLRHKERLVREQRRITVDDAAAEWERALAEIAATQGYRDLARNPQPGLLPLGRDPTSGLQEFAVARSGRTPVRDDSGRLRLDHESAMVLVLVPHGTLPAEGDRPDVVVAPFLIGKHEVTVAHWAALTGPGGTPTPDHAEQQRPFGGVQYENWYEQLHCNGLMLPDEVQWEYAARAGVSTLWPCGDDPACVPGIASLGALAPVGDRAANAFGLHDVIGNVAEFCRDADDEIHKAPGRPHSHRGGHHGDRPEDATLASRRSLHGRDVSPLVGARAARAWR